MIWARGDSRRDRFAKRPDKGQLGLRPSGRPVQSYRPGNHCGVHRWQAHLWGVRPRGDRPVRESLIQQVRSILLDSPNPV
ncbi:hypothetical protein O77CONTIG1_04903 [Leptolyngbya sp. O-77]|nr:hypothetical protein O77CONTIG1_04903 [Leptolyngbya sp. O-77]